MKTLTLPTTSVSYDDAGGMYIYVPPGLIPGVVGRILELADIEAWDVARYEQDEIMRSIYDTVLRMIAGEDPVGEVCEPQFRVQNDVLQIDACNTGIWVDLYNLGNLRPNPVWVGTSLGWDTDNNGSIDVGPVNLIGPQGNQGATGPIGPQGIPGQDGTCEGECGPGPVNDAPPTATEDMLWGGATKLVEYLHERILDAFEAINTFTSLADAAGNLVETVPILGFLPVSEFIEFLDALAEVGLLFYQSTATEYWQQQWACKLFCDLNTASSDLPSSVELSTWADKVDSFLLVDQTFALAIRLYNSIETTRNVMRYWFEIGTYEPSGAWAVACGCGNLACNGITLAPGNYGVATGIAGDDAFGHFIMAENRAQGDVTNLEMIAYIGCPQNVTQISLLAVVDREFGTQQGDGTILLGTGSTEIQVATFCFDSACGGGQNFIPATGSLRLYTVQIGGFSNPVSVRVRFQLPTSGVNLNQNMNFRLYGIELR